MKKYSKTLEKRVLSNNPLKFYDFIDDYHRLILSSGWVFKLCNPCESVIGYSEYHALTVDEAIFNLRSVVKGVYLLDGSERTVPLTKDLNCIEGLKKDNIVVADCVTSHYYLASIDDPGTLIAAWDDLTGCWDYCE